jgi:hypothetical protein
VRVLFVVKKRESYDTYSYCGWLGGLYNSALFVVDMLNANGVTAKLAQVTDNNDIDREVTRFKPDVVVIEAIWVVPEKFHILTELHPKVKWVVRVHSEIPFLALEGVAVDWISEYVEYPNVFVGANSERAMWDIRSIIRQKYGDFVALSKVEYLPNWYPSKQRVPHGNDPFQLNIGCFGAIRPFKNQLIQALAAMEFADAKSEMLKFHINATRCEQQGDNVLKNLRALFKGTGHRLIEHNWESHDQFLQTMSEMDASMAVSFSETFNIVTADAVVCSVPIVVSSEVSWASPSCFASTTNTADIVAKLDKVTSAPFKWLTVKANLRRLTKYDRDSTATWLRFLKDNG